MVALVQKENGTQRLVYYTSRTLRGVETRYPPMKLLGFALVVATHRLKLYFQAHLIRVLTEAPFKKALSVTRYVQTIAQLFD